MIRTSFPKALGALLPARVTIATMIGALPAVIGAGAPAESAEYWALQPAAAFVEAYVYACQPVEYDFAGVREPLNEVPGRVHDELFLGRYNGSCRAFYFQEVVPRLDGERQPFFVPVIALFSSKIGRPE
jgi:hypothetical protein